MNRQYCPEGTRKTPKGIEGFHHRDTENTEIYGRNLLFSVFSVSLWWNLCRFPLASWRLGGSILLVTAMLSACGGPEVTATPTFPPRQAGNPLGGTPSALQTSIAQITATAPTTNIANMTPPPPSAPSTMGGVNSATIAAGSTPGVGATTATAPASGGTAATMATTGAVPPAPRAASPVPVMDAKPLPATAVMGGTAYTNPTMTFRFAVPPGWSPPMPDGPPTRIAMRSPGNAVTLTVEESTPPDDWRRLPPANVAGLLDAAYRAATPGAALQTAVITGIQGEGIGLTTYRLTYAAGGATTERFVVLTFAGAVSVTATGATDAYATTRGTVEGIVGSLVPLKRDAPTPAPLAARADATSAPTGTMRTPSGLALALPTGWRMVATPMQPPGVEFAATSADGQQSVRVIRKAISGGLTLDDFAATAAAEFRAVAQGYDVDDEGENTVGGQRAVRALYSAVVGGRPVQGQSVAVVKGAVGYIIMVEVPAPQYLTNETEGQALFDRIGGSVMLP